MNPSTSGAAVEENKAGEFFVEAIRGKKAANGTTYFFIKWLGYPESDNTWEPIVHLSGCKKLVDAYLQNERQDIANGIQSMTPGMKRASQSSKSGSAKGKGSTKRSKKDGTQKSTNGEHIFKVPNAPRPRKLDCDAAYAMEHQESFVEYDCLTKLPRDRFPNRLIHVTVHHGRIKYLVQWKLGAEIHGDVLDDEVTCENTSLIEADQFRTQFPQTVIRFYESRLRSVEPLKEPALTEMTCDILVKAKERKSRVESIENSSDVDESTEMLNGGHSDLVDYFGLPENLDSSSDSNSGSDSGSEFAA